jgi:hypothetical protein
MREVPGICFWDFGSGWDLASYRHGAKWDADVCLRYSKRRREQRTAIVKAQRTRTNVNWKKLIPGPSNATSALLVLEGSSNQDFYSFSVAISILLSILMPTLGSRYNGGQAGCVGNSAQAE